MPSICKCVTGIVGCSDGIGWRTLSSWSWHCDTSGIFPRLHAAASACLQTSRRVLVPSRGYFAKPRLSIYRNVCTDAIPYSCFSSSLVHMLLSFHCAVC